jgi:hypothetical protein
MKVKWAGHVARMGEIQFFVGKSEGERKLGSPRRREKNNMRMNFKEIG